MSNPESLQSQIDEELRRLDNETIQQVKLTPWSDVSDLTMNVEVDVLVNGHLRRFTIISYHLLNRLFAETEDTETSSETNAYVAGEPLVIVKSIMGESIVKGILKYLAMEEGRAGM